MRHLFVQRKGSAASPKTARPHKAVKISAAASKVPANVEEKDPFGSYSTQYI